MKKQINRREFLKGLGSLIVGTFVVKFSGFLDSKKAKNHVKGLKEAKYFKEGSNLAG